MIRCADPRCPACKLAAMPLRSPLSRLIRPGDRLDWSEWDIEEDRPRRRTAYEKRVAGLDKVDGAVRMFRTWELTDDGRLEAMTNTYKWSPGENHADMSREENGGFYGFWSLSELKRQEPVWWERSQSGVPHRGSADASMYSLLYDRPSPRRFYVCGTVLGYGHLKIAEYGGKVQHAIPEYVVEPEGCDPDFALRVLNVAERYGMKIITVRQARKVKGGPVQWWKGKPIE